MKYNIFLSNDIINYLKYIYFKIGNRYCFEFDAMVMIVSMYIFSLVLNQKYSPSIVM